MILVLPWLIGASATTLVVWGFNKIKNAWDEEDRKEEEKKRKKREVKNAEAKKKWDAVERAGEILAVEKERISLEWNKLSKLILSEEKKNTRDLEEDIENIENNIEQSKTIYSFWESVDSQSRLIKDHYSDTKIYKEMKEENNEKRNKMEQWEESANYIDSHIDFLYETLRTKKEQKEEQKLIESGIYSIDKMDGYDFEKVLLAHFTRMGYKGSLTQQTQDFGADLILMKDSLKYVIQAKRSASVVSIKAVQEIIGAKGYYDGDVAIVITNNNYTENARELAYRNKVELWNREKLIQFILESKEM
jgi:HJR/Mrr/RecB family endonuclease